MTNHSSGSGAEQKQFSSSRRDTGWRLSEFELSIPVDDLTSCCHFASIANAIIMNSLRIARVAFRARPAAIRVPLQRRTYAEAVPDKARWPNLAPRCPTD